MKEFYQAPACELLYLNADDVISTSEGDIYNGQEINGEKVNGDIECPTIFF